jgi:hypothetical protein
MYTLQINKPLTVFASEILEVNFLSEKFMCKKCGASFNTKDELTKHNKEKHGM